MRIGHSCLSAEERHKRREEGLPLWESWSPSLTMPTLFKLSYPPLEDRPRVGKSVVSVRKDFCYVPVKLCFKTKISDTHALVDSGAEQSLIDHSLVKLLSLPIESLDTPINAAGLGGQHLSFITHRTKPL